jgi:hypothetical protein
MVTTSEQPVAGEEDDTPPVPAYEPMSLRTPALIVLGLAVVILVGGVVAGIITSGSTPTFHLNHVTLSDGTVVPVSPATERMRAIEANGEPPADILGNLGVLTGSKVTGVINSDQDAAQFDRTVNLTSSLAQGQVAEAYRRILTASGWDVIYQGGAPQGAAGTTEVLAKKGSGDGFYWETGVVVSPTMSAGATPYTIEVFETPDGN